jgi:hypothetical protein
MAVPKAAETISPFMSSKISSVVSGFTADLLFQSMSEKAHSPIAQLYLIGDFGSRIAWRTERIPGL